MTVLQSSLQLPTGGRFVDGTGVDIGGHGLLLTFLRDGIATPGKITRIFEFRNPADSQQHHHGEYLSII
ncbi:MULTISPECIES: hypothetical protein [unclassified Kitasatospora]|uniref:hypothetical protein n=1 Tax=unclassified Kitasatospora TaxID=2633591 RepID=UPI0024759F80|nr:hypothetical protein [Kitasatospora sp. MAP12-44]